eukprot:scaffold33610_cov233-Skeletonema_dohrnii-CCMP3373.AAC.1
MSPCCSKRICNGCVHANQMREAAESLERKCPFCRHPVTKSQEQAKNNFKRVAAIDAVAMCQMGLIRFKDGDYDTAFEYWTKATGLGDMASHYNLSLLYKKGLGVEKDEKMEVYHLEQAAISGHPLARFNLAVVEWNNGRQERAIKHWIIAATQGDDDALQYLRERYPRFVRKEDFAAALRAHQAAIDATKSLQREAATEYAIRNNINGQGGSTSPPNDGMVCSVPKSTWANKAYYKSLLILEYPSLPRSITFCTSSLKLECHFNYVGLTFPAKAQISRRNAAQFTFSCTLVDPPVITHFASVTSSQLSCHSTFLCSSSVASYSYVTSLQEVIDSFFGDHAMWDRFI